ncbi:MAG TPA: GNAT family N-acetyltransferase [Pseudonocardiaceae bacterium]
MPSLVVTRTEELSSEQLAELRRFLEEAFSQDFSAEDWEHALGGWHFLRLDTTGVLAHVAVVERRLWSGERTWRTGYVEGVAVRADVRRRGYGHEVMAAAGRLIVDGFQLGALSARPGIHGFYRRLGWCRWDGPTHVRDREGRVVATPEEDGGVLVLPTPTTGELDPTAPLICDWRPGDVW